jgi:hypothetical protein
MSKKRSAIAETRPLSDEDFINLIKAATDVELANREALGEDIKYFPSSDHGLAQGACLSPLLCNLVLEEFDGKMNSCGTRCIRYVDDFVLFAKDRKHARAAFAIGLAILAKLGLSAYDPRIDPQKAEEGSTNRRLTFLGCDLVRDTVSPSLKNRRKILQKVDTLIGAKDITVLSTMNDVGRTVLGWGNTFGFCNDEHIFGNLDREIGSRIRQWLWRRLRATNKLDSVAWLEELGVQPLAHRKRPLLEE